eukprot:1159725-Pelagomonas_calceolata.AAC.11
MRMILKYVDQSAANPHTSSWLQPSCELAAQAMSRGFLMQGLPDAGSPAFGFLQKNRTRSGKQKKLTVPVCVLRLKQGEEMAWRADNPPVCPEVSVFVEACHLVGEQQRCGVDLAQGRVLSSSQGMEKQHIYYTRAGGASRIQAITHEHALPVHTCAHLGCLFRHLSPRAPVTPRCACSHTCPAAQGVCWPAAIRGHHRGRAEPVQPVRRAQVMPGGVRARWAQQGLCDDHVQLLDPS